MTPRRIAEFAAGPLAWRGMLVAAAAILAVSQLALPDRPASWLPRASAPAPPPPPAVGSAAATPEHNYAAISEHPLFYATRRPFVAEKQKAPPAASAPAKPPLDGYKLLGIVIDEGRRLALVAPPDGGKAIHVAPGEIVDGWTLRKIAPDALFFEKQREHVELRFRWAPR